MAIEGEYYGEGNAPPDNTGKVVGIVIGVILAVIAVCVLFSLCVIGMLLLIGPGIGNYFPNFMPTY